ncbi:hypothetical protein [Xanthomonas sp. XNM01]|uniref:hypothetical protein n=1 Tax=Xanthomonas sp. XNM01 TaxID=2769289 RepID=UPI001782DEA6|nr:hypothetical protein [Xanthomonas sp. XNM01]MBD9367252.1 hypothetical protein [Xanthomonas sp. XNM01]
MFRMSCTAVLLFLAIAPVSAQSSGQQPAPTVSDAAAVEPAAEAPKEDGNEKVCKATEVTGSRFRKRVCHTREQWREIELATERQMREFDRQPVGERQQ